MNRRDFIYNITTATLPSSQSGILNNPIKMQSSSTILASSSPSRASINRRGTLRRAKSNIVNGTAPPSSPPSLPSPRPGLKRRASLLPALEFSEFGSEFSSPPRYPKRQALVSPSEREFIIQKTVQTAQENKPFYPTPLPSETGIPPSSPPPPPVPQVKRGLARTNSILSELRAPLTSVPSIELPISGDEVRLGRSSNACHYQLSASRLISRVHVRACFIPNVPRPQVEIQCIGWNGVKVHCQGHAWSLEKGDKFTSETAGAEILLDVHDARVSLKWPPTIQKTKDVYNKPGYSPFRVGREVNDENANPFSKKSSCG